MQLGTSSWSVTSDRNELTGEIKITAINSGSHHVTLVLRQIGKRLDCYVRTGEFLETVDNMHSRHSTVRYKFDEGPIVSQSWIISDDNDALFYPTTPRPFLEKMRNAKRFVIEYKPADIVRQTASFDVSAFPQEFAAPTRLGGTTF